MIQKHRNKYNKAKYFDRYIHNDLVNDGDDREQQQHIQGVKRSGSHSWDSYKVSKHKHQVTNNIEQHQNRYKNKTSKQRQQIMKNNFYYDGNNVKIKTI